MKIKKKILAGILIAVIFIIVVQFIPTNSNNDSHDNTPVERINNGTFLKFYDVPYRIDLDANNVIYITPRETDEGNNIVKIPMTSLLFNHTYYLYNHLNKYAEIKPVPEYADLYNKLGFYNTAKKIVFVYPIFTQSAYAPNGFYDYYSGRCDSRCLTTAIDYDEHGKYTSSVRAAAVLTLLHYPYITDVDIDKNPEILKRYDRIIMLHSEYVTKREFDAVTHHPDVIYLFANSMYAEITSNYDDNTITLIRGHGYPDKTIRNGFDWKYDNSQYEYDNVCDNWNYTKIDDGKILNCYPSFRLFYDKDLLTSLKN